MAMLSHDRCDHRPELHAHPVHVEGARLEELPYPHGLREVHSTVGQRRR